MLFMKFATELFEQTLYYFKITIKEICKTCGQWLHDNSNSDNSNSYEIFQGAISQNII